MHPLSHIGTATGTAYLSLKRERDSPSSAYQTPLPAIMSGALELEITAAIEVGSASCRVDWIFERRTILPGCTSVRCTSIGKVRCTGPGVGPTDT